ncbi:hypothetical protein [Catellatospora sichuanensis]|uniref:hypothetical protein n=1 Tax=Catellatospora sichuanensis TaxID=1969805 RepID=UPI00118388F2|nr:hypothetical protein [Catellatospora sichuanensis]
MSEQNMTLLEAGAVLPAGAPVAKDDTVDALTSRAYRHPVLGERTVVRLVPGTIGAAEDLSMEFLGFDKPAPVNEVGLVRQQALGFPAWALVHDPANGHHALALVKEIERLARQAKSRIGPAKDGFNALGERLARAVPHFLPTFYEEAGRAFLAADSTTYAATMFGKARDAERAYALRIDEERQHAVFLEFALAGALTAKALSQHARELAARCTPADAYERFLRLCVERTLGGLPPYAQMHTDLRRLAKAAKLDQAEADRQVLGQLLSAPSLSRAPEGFWAAYAGPLSELAAADPALRGRLLGMFPQHVADDVWLEVLERAGATAALTEPQGTVPFAAESPDGPAGWLGRFDVHRQRRGWRLSGRSAHLLALLDRMSGRLKADGLPVVLCRRHSGVDLDLLDACLALGVPVADPETARYLVSRWLTDEREGRRDLVALAGDGRFLGALAEAVEQHLRPNYREITGDPERVRAVTAVPGLRTAAHALLDRLAAQTAGHGLPTLGAHLDRLAVLGCPDGVAVNPEAAGQLLGHDVAALLGRTLRTGLLDELGWPALEDAVARLGVTGTDDEDNLAVVAQWPHLVLRRGDLVLVVGEHGVELEHMLRIPADQRHYLWRLVLRYVDRQLLVCWDIGRERSGYWSGAPDDVFTVPDNAFDMSDVASLPLPRGGRTAGGRPLHVGDRSERRVGRVLTDGVTHWVVRHNGTTLVCQEFDPVTGERGRASLPAFFEDGAADSETLVLGSSRLAPRDPGAPGAESALLGWRVRRRADGSLAGQSTDGTAYTLPPTVAKRGELVGALHLPGSDVVCGVLSTHHWRNSTLTLVDPEGLVLGEYTPPQGPSAYARGTRLVPTAGYWHLLRPRDEAGSAALRAVTDEECAALLGEAVEAVSAAADAAAAQEALTDLVARHLPAVTDPSLRAGIGGLVERAAAHVTRLAELRDRCEGRAAATAAAPAEQWAGGVQDHVLAAALSGLMPYCYSRGDSAVRLLTGTGAAFTAAEAPTGQLDLQADDDWFDVLGVLPAVMYRAASPVTSPEHRAALLELLDVCARSGLLAPGARLRQIQLKSDKPVDEDGLPGTVLTFGARRLLVLSADTDDREVTGLEYAPDGVFAALPGYAITREKALDPGIATPDVLAEFTRLLAEHGPVAWQQDRVAVLSDAAGISLAEATMVLAGLPQHPWHKAESEPVREQLGGVDAAAAAAAASRMRLGHVTVTARTLSLLLPTDLGTLWRDGPAIGAFAAAWTERHGVRRPVRDELIVAIDKAGVDGSMNASDLIHGIASPDTCRWLHGTVKGIDDEDVLVALAKCVPWLVYHLPADDPIRAALPRVVELAQARLADPGLSLPVGYIMEKKADAMLAATGATPVTGPDGVSAGAVLLPPDTGWRVVHLRPALLTGADDPVLHVLRAKLESHDEGTFAALHALAGGQLARLVGYPVPAGIDGFAQDPTRSVPDLVARVAQERGLPADAAALYLQLLALPDPTDRNTALWTGWKPARLKAARAALAATDLVVEAKRPRAGRSLFLPGGWLALKAPHLPLERWKLPLLIGGENGVSGLDIVLPVAPAPQLFDLAWDRITAGDGPRFDELVTERRR